MSVVELSENEVEFLPFHAINEFMRDDFRLNVIRVVLSSLPTLQAHYQEAINRQTRKHVKVPGFRNSDKAPAAVKILPLASAFQKHPEVAAAMLAAWAEARATLRGQVYEVLKSRGWPLFPEDVKELAATGLPRKDADWGMLPPDADRTRLPGFLINWPKGQSYEAIYDSFTAAYPDAQGSLDEISLMAVWLVLRLPYQVAAGDEAAEKNSL